MCIACRQRCLAQVAHAGAKWQVGGALGFEVQRAHVADPRLCQRGGKLQVVAVARDVDLGGVQLVAAGAVQGGSTNGMQRV